MIHTDDTTTIPLGDSQEDNMMFMTTSDVQKYLEIDHASVTAIDRSQKSFVSYVRKLFL